MMGERTVAQEALLYSFSLERHVPASHMLRSVDRFLDLSGTVGRLWGEAQMTAPARRRARAVAAAGAPAWLYRFSYVPERARATVPGAGHEAEVEMVFDTPSPRFPVVWTAADAMMALLISGYWVAFASTGDPNHAGAPTWPRFTPRRIG